MGVLLIGTDGHIYIWHKEFGQLVEDIEAHKSSCNSVSWNPKNPQMFASAGDDNTVRMYVYLRSRCLTPPTNYDRWTTQDPRVN